VTKYLTTLCLIGGGILPILVDVNTSHLLNPDWDSHARVHEAWRLSTNFLVFSLGIFLLWSKNREILAGLVSLCIHLGFVIAAILMPLYGGEPVGEGIPEPEILMVPFNVFFFGSMFLLQGTVIFVLFKKKKFSLSNELK
jgi:hypothetical protein|tara:strand:+ start:598 stop:1017 length:420 start_codon:yes stop_codon:yes gene_type:complete